MEKKRVAILTWFNQGQNIGQTLQAYALQYFVKEKMHRNYKVEVLCYDSSLPQNDINIKEYFVSKKMRTESIKHELCEKFNMFVKNRLILSPPFSRRYQLYPYLQEQKFDYLVAGSDQIWNPNTTDSAYYFDFDAGDAVKISYASSLISKGEFFNYKERFEELSQLYETFQYLSSRETDGKYIIESLVNKSVEWVVDPVFLLSSQEWERLVIDNSMNCSMEEGYILIYVFYPEGLNEKLEEIKNRYGNKKIIIIDTDLKVDECNENYYIWRNVGPEEFLILIKNSSVVVTDSFHGVAFSIIFKKEFWGLTYNLEKAKDKYSFPERITDLLDSIECDRCISGQHENFFDDLINYEKIYEKLTDRIQSSKNYLERALSS